MFVSFHLWEANTAGYATSVLVPGVRSEHLDGSAELEIFYLYVVVAIYRSTSQKSRWKCQLWMLSKVHVYSLFLSSFSFLNYFFFYPVRFLSTCIWYCCQLFIQFWSSLVMVKKSFDFKWLLSSCSRVIVALKGVMLSNPEILSSKLSRQILYCILSGQDCKIWRTVWRNWYFFLLVVCIDFEEKIRIICCSLPLFYENPKTFWQSNPKSHLIEAQIPVGFSSWNH